MIARRYYITGIVQGVGFRYFVKRKADLYGIAGWVRNLPDGRVEVFAQGDPEVLNEFEKELWKGPSLARVDNIESHEESPSLNTHIFEIRFW
ncbi:MAG: acylphosphatase [Candidatus Aminicenantes bacterium]|nr:acylphosphatase [Candidatus Aminicenantes bacterium]